MENEQVRICGTCGKERTIDDYCKSTWHKGGRHSTCKHCFNKNRAKRRKANPDMFLNQSLKDRFGITLDEYKAKLMQQRGVCAICGQPETFTHKGKLAMLSVDHNHSNGQMRGLLCQNCNHMIGHSREDSSILDSGIRYLMFWRDCTQTSYMQPKMTDCERN